jgi:DegV family protein with EDD domain
LPKKTIKIFIDSAFSFLPEEIADKNIFEVIPMTINLGFYKYKDITGFAPGLLSEVEKKKRKLATTAAPSMLEYCQIFEKALAEGYTQVISLHPDSRLSGSYEQAFLAAQRLGNLPIRVIDTKLFSLGFYFLYGMLRAMKVITVDSLERALKSTQNSVTEIIVVNSLERLGLDKLPEFSKLILDCVPILQHTSENGLQPVAREKDTRAAVKYIIDNLPKQAELIFGYAEKNLLNLANSFRSKKNIKKIPYSVVIPANFGRALWGLALKSC